MKLVLDACSVILLGKATVLEDAARLYRLIIPDEVYNEIIKGKADKYIDVLIMERLYNKKLLEKKPIKNKQVLQKIEKDFGLGKGEAETIALLIEDKYDAMVTDNKQGRKTAKILNLKLLGSPEIIVALYKKNKINKTKAESALKKLDEFGWYEKYLIERVMEEIKK